MAKTADDPKDMPEPTHGPHKPWRSKKFTAKNVKLTIRDPKTGEETVIGRFESFSVAPDYSLKEPYVLGRFEPKKPAIKTVDRRKKSK